MACISNKVSNTTGISICAKIAMDNAYQHALSSQNDDLSLQQREEREVEAIVEEVAPTVITVEVVDKAISFHPLVQVRFVPTRYEVEHLQDDLFWRSEDYDDFKQEALHEIRAYHKATGFSSKQAITALYQPLIEETALELALRTLRSQQAAEHAPEPVSGATLPPSPTRLTSGFLRSHSTNLESAALSSSLCTLKHVGSIYPAADHSPSTDSADTDNESNSSLETDEGRPSWESLDSNDNAVDLEPIGEQFVCCQS